MARPCHYGVGECDFYNCARDFTATESFHARCPGGCDPELRRRKGATSGFDTKISINANTIVGRCLIRGEKHSPQRPCCTD
jgi:hypothetical protein